MTDQQPPSVLTAVSRLRGALEQAADALASPRLETLLASECAIEGALSELPALDALTPSERVLVRAELDRARTQLLRCRRLGSALGDFIRLSFEAQGRNAGYGRPDLTYSGYAL